MSDIITQVQKKKAYIIEQDANILHGLNANLSHKGFMVETGQGLNDKNSVINQARLFKPDLIILDLVMAKIDGFELLYDLKADSGFDKTKIFVFTSDSDINSKKRCQNMGANYYFLKNGFNLNEFTLKVKKIINNLDRIYEKN